MNFIDNNKKAYYSYIEKPNEAENVDVIDFLNQISNSGYIFNKEVVIVTDKKTYQTRIAGKLGAKIITLDNDSININDIKKIYLKK